ncbi:MAG: leucine-rich repeat domain-containing protein [Clostridia bacterium]|nr:leucine-rich repeat domain-containing protein [Clostridia bacterium]
MKRLLAFLLAAALLLPACGLAEDEDDWDDWYDPDWRADWEEWGYFDFCDVQDDTLILFEGVTALGYAGDGYWDDELGTDVEAEPKFEGGLHFEGFWNGDIFKKVSFPSSLRYLGIEAFSFLHLTELTLPAQLEALENGAFYACTFDTFRIEATLPASDILKSLYDCLVAAYEVPEDHPLYKSVDGVLFSKDGKTLLAYPNYSKAEHYDVPAGVEHIGEKAFSNEYLKTVSLPIGLKSVGDYGFADCTRLQSIALPLTVKEIGKRIFSYCISLELVSLPEGLEAEKIENKWWAEYYPDDAIFRGDNGDTLTVPKEN